jgi:hypothetical protein
MIFPKVFLEKVAHSILANLILYDHSQIINVYIVSSTPASFQCSIGKSGVPLRRSCHTGSRDTLNMLVAPKFNSVD